MRPLTNILLARKKAPLHSVRTLRRLVTFFLGAWAGHNMHGVCGCRDAEQCYGKRSRLADFADIYTKALAVKTNWNAQ